MNEVKSVLLGNIFIGVEGDVVRAQGIGVSVFVSLYSKLRKCGGIAHIIMGVNECDGVCESLAWNAQVGIGNLLRQLGERGVGKELLVAKIVGGANLFANVQGRSQKLGIRNTEAVQRILREEGIPVVAEIVGGRKGREVVFDFSTGLVEVKYVY